MAAPALTVLSVEWKSNKELGRAADYDRKQSDQRLATTLVVANRYLNSGRRSAREAYC